MSLYWNDEFDYFNILGKKIGNDFVLVRKLFVQPNDGQFPSSETLLTSFSKYGEVENVEIPDRGEYAHITFKDSESANKALRDQQNLRCSIQPADTWKQPDLIAHDKNQPEILSELNNDCLIEVFRFLDVDGLLAMTDISDRFEDLIQENVIKKISSIKFNYSHVADSPSTLAKMRRALQHIGPTIKIFRIEFNFRTSPRNLHRIMDKVAQYVTADLDELSISGVELTPALVLQLRNQLSRTKVFKIHSFDGSFENDVNLIPFCPNLRKLRLGQDMTFVQNSRSWPKLENFSLRGTEFIVPDTLMAFFRNNPQLKRLNLTIDDTDEVFEGMSQHLPNLEKITIYNGIPEIDSSHIQKLSGLKHLKAIKLLYLRQGNFDGILRSLATDLKGLTQIKLLVSCSEDLYSPDPDAVLAVARKLQHLTDLCLINCELSETIVIRIIEYAVHLRKLSLLNSKLVMNESFLQAICAARKQVSENVRLEIVIDEYEDPVVDELLLREDTRRIIKIKKLHCDL